MNRSLVCVLACLALLLGASLALAEGIVAEVYRSPHGWPGGAAVDPSDGSVWAVSGTSVLHLDAEGHVLLRYAGLARPAAPAVDPVDGSCWVGEGLGGSHVAHLSRDGAVLWRGDYHGMWCSVNPADGSAWFSAYDSLEGPFYLVHVSADGEELGRLSPEGIANPGPATVSPFDGSLWVYGADVQTEGTVTLYHLSATGTLLGQHPGVGYRQAINPTDGSCWTGGAEVGVMHISASDDVLWTGAAYREPTDIAVNPSDGSCWVQYFPGGALSNCGQTLAHLAADGSELSHLNPPLDWPFGSLAVNPSDGTLWVGARSGWTHLASDGSVLWQDRGPGYALTLAVDPATGDYWMGGRGDCYGPDRASWLSRHDPLGDELWRHTGFTGAPGVSAAGLDPTDGSLWTVGGDIILHMAADGTQLPFTATYGTGVLYEVAVDPGDRSLWACQGNEIRHYAPEGTLLGTVTYSDVSAVRAIQVMADGPRWATGDVQGPPPANAQEAVLMRVVSGGGYSLIDSLVRVAALSVDPHDGSVWTLDYGTHAGWGAEDAPLRVTHLSSDGTILWQGGEQYDANQVAVDPATGNCWVLGDGGPVSLLSPTGEELGRTDQSYVAFFATVDPADGTLWLLDETSGLCKVASSGPFSDVAATSWAAPAVSVCAAADVVKGYWDGSYHPAEQVTRDQMAVYIARAFCGSDADVPEGPATPSFGDVAADFWAYNQIEYCKAQNIVQGHDGNYQPELPLDRAQMATFLARAIVPFADRPDLASYTAPSTPSFADVAPDFWAYKPIEYVRLRYVARGYWDGRYHPDDACTRDQMAVFMARAFHLFQ